MSGWEPNFYSPHFSKPHCTSPNSGSYNANPAQFNTIPPNQQGSYYPIQNSFPESQPYNYGLENQFNSYNPPVQNQNSWSQFSEPNFYPSTTPEYQNSAPLQNNFTEEPINLEKTFNDFLESAARFSEACERNTAQIEQLTLQVAATNSSCSQPNFCPTLPSVCPEPYLDDTQYNPTCFIPAEASSHYHQTFSNSVGYPQNQTYDSNSMNWGFNPLKLQPFQKSNHSEPPEYYPAFHISKSSPSIPAKRTFYTALAHLDTLPSYYFEDFDSDSDESSSESNSHVDELESQINTNLSTILDNESNDKNLILSSNPVDEPVLSSDSISSKKSECDSDEDPWLESLALEYFSDCELPNESIDLDQTQVTSNSISKSLEIQNHSPCLEDDQPDFELIANSYVDPYLHWDNCISVDKHKLKSKIIFMHTLSPSIFHKLVLVCIIFLGILGVLNNRFWHDPGTMQFASIPGRARPPPEPDPGE